MSNSEKDLSESERYYRTLIHSLHEDLLVIDRDFRITDINNMALKTLGKTRQEVIGRLCYEVSHGLNEPCDKHGSSCPLNQVFDTGEPVNCRHEHVTSTSEIVHVDILASPIKDSKGNVTHVIEAIRDISDLFETQETLKKNEERYRELYERSPLAYESLDADGCFINVNEAWLDMLGYTHEEVIGQWCGNFLAPHQVELFRERFPLFKAAGKVHTEFDMKHKDGSIITVAVDGKIGYDEKGDFKQTHCILNDITERKKVEQEIRKLTEELEQRVVKRTAQLEAVNQELEAFAYSVSHDLRAPLRHIDGFIGLLQKRTATALDERSRHYMDTISASVKRMDMLIRDLLSFSRMGSYKMSKRPVDMGVLMQEVIREFEPETGNRNINWRIGDLPVVTGDRAMLKMVLANLISNALKFTQSRQQTEIEIGWMQVQETETVIFVRDNGVGFDMNYVDKLFGVFQRLHRADEFEGTGIGLANVRRIINRHGGRTWATGEVNQGAIFYFSLPHI